MVQREITGCNFEGGFSSLIYEGDSQDTDHPPIPNSNQDRQTVSTYSLTPWTNSQLAAVSLALLAPVLLVVDISLGVHYHKVTETNHTLNDTAHIINELNKLQDAYKTAIENTEGAKKQLEREMSRQKPVSWEFEHQTKRSKDYEVQLDKMNKDVAALRYHLPMLKSGCRSCPQRWILINSACYYFSISDTNGKSWEEARTYCKMYGGDLAIIDSKDKENATINYLMNNKYRYSSTGAAGFWIGVRDFPKEGIWKWVDGRVLVEGYWKDGEPNNDSNNDCGAVYANENFFKAWNDVKCPYPQKWICEKAPNSS